METWFVSFAGKLVGPFPVFDGEGSAMWWAKKNVPDDVEFGIEEWHDWPPSEEVTQ